MCCGYYKLHCYKNTYHNCSCYKQDGNIAACCVVPKIGKRRTQSIPCSIGRYEYAGNLIKTFFSEQVGGIKRKHNSFKGKGYCRKYSIYCGKYFSRCRNRRKSQGKHTYYCGKTAYRDCFSQPVLIVHNSCKKFGGGQDKKGNTGHCGNKRCAQAYITHMCGIYTHNPLQAETCEKDAYKRGVKAGRAAYTVKVRSLQLL